MAKDGKTTESKLRFYPDAGLRKVDGEYESSLTEMVRQNFKKPDSLRNR